MRAKRDIILGVFAFCLLLMIFVVYSTPIVQASLGEARISKGWDKVYSTDEDYFVWIADKNKQKTEICLLNYYAKKLNDISNEKKAYIKEDKKLKTNLIKQQKKVQQTKLDKDYYGYCKTINTEDYIKFGENSTILTYINGSRISYIIDENIIDIILYKKFESDYLLHPEDIFLYNLEGVWKFGANDSENNGIEQYKYVVNTNNIGNNYLLGERIYITINNEIHEIDFIDICSNNYSNCEFNDLGNGIYEIYFNSTSFIDPTIQVSNQQSFDIDLEPINETSFLVAVQQNSTLSVLGYYINGTKLFPDKLIANNIGLNSRVDIAKINNSAFVLGYLTENNGGEKHYLYLNMQGQNISHNIFAEVVGTPNTDLELVTYNDKFIMCHVEDSTNNAHSTLYNYSNLNNGTEFLIDGNIAPNLPLQNLIQCDYINNTSYAYLFFNDAGNTLRLSVLSNNNDFILSNQNLDATTGEQSNIAMTILNNSRIYVAWVDDGTGDNLKLTGYYPNGSQFLSDISVRVVSNTDNYIGMTSVVDNANKEYIVIAGHDRGSNKINSSIYYSNGTFIRNIILASDVNSSNIVFDIKGEDVPKGYGNYNDTFLLGYTNTSGLTKVVIYHINGSISSEFYFDLITPSITLNTPPNNLLTNILTRNFTANITDNIQLASANLIIKNNTSITSNQTIAVSGVSAFVGIVYNFILDGLYNWYYIVKDTNNNIIESEQRNITIDTNAPIINYIFPTEENLTLILNNYINVNVSVDDLSPTNTTIFLYNASGMGENYTIESLVYSFNSNESIVYYKFENLTEDEYFFNVSSCDLQNYCSTLPLRHVDIGAVSNIQMNVEISSYPYADLNETIDVSISLTADEYILTYENVTMTITELDTSNTTIQLNYNPLTTKYEASFYFTELGNYPFTILADLDNGFDKTASGTFLVRNPYYITIQGFVNTLEDEYINEFAYVTAELTNQKVYDNILELFIAPITPQSIYGKPVWFAPYEDGEATIKLYEPNTTYAFRLIDGIITFPSSYSVPNITKTYGTNTFISTYTFEGNNETIKVLFTEKDLHPYRWLANILLLIGLGMSIIIALFMLFLIPDKPVIALSFALIIAGGIILLRVFIFLWLGE